MSKSKLEAQNIIELIRQGKSIQSLQTEVYPDPTKWQNYSAKAYELNLQTAKKERKAYQTRKHTSATSNEEVLAIIALNNKLADYALLLPIFSTMGDFSIIADLAEKLPGSEKEIIRHVGLFTMDLNRRVHQKIGRLELFDHFKVFSKMIDAAVLCYYRLNFISCYFTLLPVIEGILIRWMGYSESTVKPNFDDISNFFKNSHARQPSPSNIMFHRVYAKACDKILNEHFYRPTNTGSSYANFNRHVASHLLNDSQFATQENCIRLFLLLDTMTEIYCYESQEPDPRFSLSKDEVAPDFELFKSVWLSNIYQTAEQIMLKEQAGI